MPLFLFQRLADDKHEESSDQKTRRPQTREVYTRVYIFKRSKDVCVGIFTNMDI